MHQEKPREMTKVAGTNAGSFQKSGPQLDPKIVGLSLQGHPQSKVVETASCSFQDFSKKNQQTGAELFRRSSCWRLGSFGLSIRTRVARTPEIYVLPQMQGPAALTSYDARDDRASVSTDDG